MTAGATYDCRQTAGVFPSSRATDSIAATSCFFGGASAPASSSIVHAASTVPVQVRKTAVTEYVYVPSGTTVSVQEVLVVNDDELVPQAALVAPFAVVVRVT